MYFPQGSRSDKNILYRKLRRLWHGMISRCYNVKHHSYKNYGGNRVTVCEEWKTLSGFLDSIDSVQGWNETLYIEGKLALDKDSLITNNKVYSPETCCFITLEENNKIKPNQQRLMCGWDKLGNYYEFYNQSDFARTHNLTQTSISDCLKGRLKTHRGWTFSYKDV